MTIDEYSRLRTESSIILNKLIVVISTLIVIIIISRNILYTQVQGRSMEPSLKDGDIYMSLDASKVNIDYEDIVVIYTSEGLMIKRVVGLPNDFIVIDGGEVYLNNHKLEEKYKIGSTYREKNHFNKWLLKEDEYFLLGDNRGNSIDSRLVGPVEYKSIKSKVITEFDGNRLSRINYRIIWLLETVASILIICLIFLRSSIVKFQSRYY